MGTFFTALPPGAFPAAVRADAFSCFLFFMRSFTCTQNPAAAHKPGTELSPPLTSYLTLCVAHSTLTTCGNSSKT
jgi:hypothetical protein